MYHGITLGQQRAAKQLVELILARGHRISVHDGEAWAIKRSDDQDKILDAMGNTDSDTLRITRVGHCTGEGNIFLVWGNATDGSDLISDYTVAPEVEAIVKEHWRVRGDV